MNTSKRRLDRRSVLVLALALAMVAGEANARGDDPASDPPRVEWIEGDGGAKVPGRISGDPEKGYVFTPGSGGEAVPIEKAGAVTFEGPGPDASSATPPFRAELGPGQRISGRLGGVDDLAVRLEDGPGRKAITLSRAGVLALTQRPGEALVLQEGFEAIEASRWSIVGEPTVVVGPKLAGDRALRLPAGGAGLTHRLPEPVGSGRLEVAFHDDGRVVAGQRWFVDLTFRGPSGDEWVRALLGWDEETLAVQSSPGGPALAVQRLSRRPGWHRLVVRFGPDRTDLSVDGDELAHGAGPAGPLQEIRIATQSSNRGDPPRNLAGGLDDFRLARLAEPVGGLEVEPSQDEIRLVGGDQLFGRLKGADAEGATLETDGRDVSIAWREVAGVYFRRGPAQAPPIQGLWARLEWRAAPGNDPRDLDQAEGVLRAVTDEALELETPFAGTLSIPRERLRRLRVVGQARRVVLDASPHHLGNEVVRDLDPPQPQGSVLEVPFTLEAVPEGAAFLAVDALQVAGEADALPFSAFVKGGELRTNVTINGKEVDYLNRHVRSKNEAPERIRLAIPAGLLKVGKNIARFEEVGKKDDPNDLDDLGILGVALESDARPAAAEKRP